MVIGKKQAKACRDGFQPRAERIGVELVRDVRRVHDPSQAEKRGVGQLVLGDDHLKGTLAITMSQVDA